MPRSLFMLVQVVLLATPGPQSAVVPQCLDYPPLNTEHKDNTVLTGVCSARGISSSLLLRQPPFLDTTVLHGWQDGTVSTESTVLKNAHFDSTAGHDTATVGMPRSLFMLVQVVLLATPGPQSAVVPQCLDYPPLNTEHKDNTVLTGVCSARGLSSSLLLRQPPFLDTTVLHGWQDGTVSTESTVLKNAHFDSTAGHDTATVGMPRSLFMLVQVVLLATPGPQSAVVPQCLDYPPLNTEHKDNTVLTGVCSARGISSSLLLRQPPFSGYNCATRLATWNSIYGKHSTKERPLRQHLRATTPQPLGCHAHFSCLCRWCCWRRLVLSRPSLPQCLDYPPLNTEHKDNTVLTGECARHAAYLRVCYCVNHLFWIQLCYTAGNMEQYLRKAQY
ncbi:hypothetical protein MTO96_036902 [Rhipicephalus appendiculatus]